MPLESVNFKLDPKVTKVTFGFFQRKPDKIVPLGQYLGM
jgi:hypothetical protein